MPFVPPNRPIILVVLCAFAVPILWAVTAGSYFGCGIIQGCYGPRSAIAYLLEPSLGYDLGTTVAHMLDITPFVTTVVLLVIVWIAKRHEGEAEDVGEALTALNRCDRCKTTFPSFHYLTKVDGKGFLCEKCRSAPESPQAAADPAVPPLPPVSAPASDVSLLERTAVRRRWITIVICACVVICAVAFLARSRLWPKPYDSMVARLRPGMSSGEVVAALGEPRHKGDVGAWTSLIYDDGANHPYPNPGENTLLMIAFDQDDIIRGWIIVEGDDTAEDRYFALESLLFPAPNR